MLRTALSSCSRSTMAATRFALLWRLLLTLLFLAGWQCSSCKSSTADQIRPSYYRSIAAVGLHRYDRSLESGAVRRASPAGDRLHGFDSGRPSRTRLSLLGKESSRLVALETTPVNEVQLLIAFKAEITSDPLGQLDGWSANDSDACGWKGVECSPNSKHVAALNLGDLQLEGNISPRLGQLSFLQQLDLSNNSLSGAIPASLANCSDLSYLNISFNLMSGDIPVQVRQLQNLRTLDLSTNNLTGNIPAALGNCSSLEYLDLGTNTIEGEIPSQLGRLSKLQVLRLNDNSISGTLPSELGNCSSLTQLALTNNIKLGGRLPSQLRQLSRLQQFSALTCNFGGEFPSWVVNWTDLQVINLGFNQFAGPIPEDIGYRLSNLTTLGLAENFFTGEIPRSIVNMSSLVGMHLEENMLSGTIPSDIGLLKNLEEFFVYENALTGIIPSSLSNCSRLTYFMVGINPFDSQVLPSWIGSFPNLQYTYFADMNLYGEIPVEVGQLSQVIEFLVFENNLTGPVPPSFGNCSSLQNFDIRSNQLTSLPSELGNLPILYLQIGSNSFPSDRIPAFAFNLSLIQWGMQFNHLNGRLDAYDFGRFGDLEIAEFYFNDWEGPIPRGFANCSNMYILELSGNRLSGELPSWFANLTFLGDLYLGENLLSGSIPEGLIAANYQLSEVDLSLNKFEGTIPEGLCATSSLQTLLLNSNNLTGEIPSSLGNCTEMVVLDLSQNRLTGGVPGDTLSQMSQSLSTLDISDNLLSGRWPVQISQLINVQSINVSGNNMTGSIPPGLGACVALETLDFSLNQFSGPLPPDLGSLRHLETFNASYNNFSGPVPDSGAFKSNVTAASFLGNPDLCGRVLGVQRLCPVQGPSPSPRRRSRCKGFKCTHVWVSILAAVAFVISLLALVMGVYLFGRRRARRPYKGAGFNIDPRMKFSREDIIATVAAGDEHVIGKGARSTVYKAVLKGGETVAIKILKDLPRASTVDQESQEAKQLQAEISSEARTLAMMRHRNIIKVFGLCPVTDVMAIVLEYMPNGSLYAHLHESSHESGPCQLTWAERFKILLGVTHGMVYLHHEFPDPIIHRDLKSSNILLDANLEPKVCDFGFSKVVAGDSGEATASTFCGTFGYMPPEYGTGARVSTKGDVFSFGVVVLELLTAKKAVQAYGPSEFGISENIVNIVEQCFQESESLAFDLLDPVLREEGEKDPKAKGQMMLVLRVGLLCTKIVPQNRPSMNAVLEMLQQIKEVGEKNMTQRTLDDLLGTYAPSSSQSPVSSLDWSSMTQSY